MKNPHVGEREVIFKYRILKNIFLGRFAYIRVYILRVGFFLLLCSNIQDIQAE